MEGLRVPRFPQTCPSLYHTITPPILTKKELADTRTVCGFRGSFGGPHEDSSFMGRTIVPLQGSPTNCNTLKMEPQCFIYFVYVSIMPIYLPLEYKICIIILE